MFLIAKMSHLLLIWSLNKKEKNSHFFFNKRNYLILLLMALCYVKIKKYIYLYNTCIYS